LPFLVWRIRLFTIGMVRSVIEKEREDYHAKAAYISCECNNQKREISKKIKKDKKKCLLLP